MIGFAMPWKLLNTKQRPLVWVLTTITNHSPSLVPPVSHICCHHYSRVSTTKKNHERVFPGQPAGFYFPITDNAPCNRNWRNPATTLDELQGQWFSEQTDELALHMQTYVHRVIKLRPHWRNNEELFVNVLCFLKKLLFVARCFSIFLRVSVVAILVNDKSRTSFSVSIWGKWRPKENRKYEATRRNKNKYFFSV